MKPRSITLLILKSVLCYVAVPIMVAWGQQNHLAAPEELHPSFLREIYEKYDTKLHSAFSNPGHVRLSLWKGEDRRSSINFSWKQCKSKEEAAHLVMEDRLLKSAGPMGQESTKGYDSEESSTAPRDNTLPGEFAQVRRGGLIPGEGYMHLIFARGENYVELSGWGALEVRDIGLRVDRAIQASSEASFQEVLDTVFPAESEEELPRVREPKKRDYNDLVNELEDPALDVKRRRMLIQDIADLKVPQSRELLATVIKNKEDDPYSRTYALDAMTALDPEFALAEAYSLVEEVPPLGLKASADSDFAERQRLDALSYLRTKAMRTIGHLENPVDALLFLKQLDLTVEPETVATEVPEKIGQLEFKLSEEGNGN